MIYGFVMPSLSKTRLIVTLWTLAPHLYVSEHKHVRQCAYSYVAGTTELHWILEFKILQTIANPKRLSCVVFFFFLDSHLLL